MGFLAGYALSLFGRPQDRLSHVLVDPAFEQHADFFYPPPEPRVLLSQSRDQRPIRTDRCGLVLADIPFVRLRDSLPADLLAGGWSFKDTVASLQERFRPAELEIDLERRTVRAHGREVRCTPIELAFWAWLAERRCARAGDGAIGKDDPAAFARFHALYAGLVEPERAERTRRAHANDPKKDWLSERIARHNNLVERTLGAASVQYRIEASGKRPATRWRLATPPEAIRLSWLPSETSPA